MDQLDSTLKTFIEGFGWLAPILFVFLHLIRPILFLPVIVVCIAGGVVFGFFEGALLSFIGLSLMSFVSYVLVNKFPNFRDKMARLKEKMFPNRTLSVGQVMILRIMPFIHFHLLSLYLMETTKNLREYMYFSTLGLIMPAILYTAFGQVITEMPWYVSLLMFAVLAILFVAIDRYHKHQIEAD